MLLKLKGKIHSGNPTATGKIKEVKFQVKGTEADMLITLNEVGLELLKRKGGKWESLIGSEVELLLKY